MADQQTETKSEQLPNGGCGRRSGRFSPGLFVVGLLAVIVSAWALAGPSSWAAVSVIPLGWILVVAAIVVGVVLVLSPRKRRR